MNTHSGSKQRLLVSAISILLGFVLIVAGIGKSRVPAEGINEVMSLLSVSPTKAASLLVILMAAELTLGSFLITVRHSNIVLRVSVGLFFFFAFVHVVFIMQGVQYCNCAGKWGAAIPRWAMVLIDLGLAVLALTAVRTLRSPARNSGAPAA